MDKWELSHWLAYFQLHPPITADLLNLLFAQVCAVTAKTGFGRLRRDNVADFLLHLRGAPRKPKATKALWMAWAGRYQPKQR